MDSRVFYFSKWILPKTKSFYRQEANQISVGYFDFVSVKKISCSSALQPLEAYAKDKTNSYDLEKSDNLELTKQEFFAFTNTGDENINIACYDEKKLEAFWNNESFIRFYSFLHISNAASKKEIFKIIKTINHVFNQDKGEEYNTICYFSLDYSDIIICSKCESILDYSKAVFNLNYNQPQKLVRDSFSLISIEYEATKKINSIFLESTDSIEFNLFKEKIVNEFGNLKCFEDEFVVSLNFGIQNYKVFKELENKLLKNNVSFDKYKLLGRHDITINNNKADLAWLIIVQNFLDLYSITDRKRNLSYETVIFNCETYIRLPFDESESYSEKCEVDIFENQKYQNAQDKLQNVVKSYLDNNILKNEHKTPIYALYFSLLGLLKNGFAEDFVICIYSSFISFLQYMTKEIENNKYENLEFDRCFNSYFDNINALTNSAMHSERQFIQSPSFNPVFYDLPPKLMAYYTAITNTEAAILNTGDKGTYSFMFRPSFSRDIKITSFSYNDYPPTDRLLAVTINETDLYSPFQVISQMCHEVAHYVGDKNRNREYRKEVFLKCVIYDIIYNFFKSENLDYTDETNITEYIYDVVELIKKEPYYKNNKGYSTDFYELIYIAINSIYSKPLYKDLTENLLKNSIKDTNIISVSCIYNDFREYLVNVYGQILRDSIEDIQIRNDINVLKSILSETYADMQMILILDLNLEEYLNKFDRAIFNNRTSLTEQNEAYSRILNIIMFFTMIGKWDLLLDDSSKYYDLMSYIYKDIFDIMNYPSKDTLHALLCDLYGEDNLIYDKISYFKDKKSNWKRYLYWNIGIQNYLSRVYSKSIETYSSNQKKAIIKSFNKQLTDIRKFDNAIDVFTSIQTFNDKYAKKLYS